MNIWAIMRWEIDGRHVAQITRVSHGDLSDVMATVSSDKSFSDALVRARLMAKLNCAFQGERWAMKSATEALKLLEKQKIT